MSRRRDQMLAPLLVLAAFVGLWIGHTLEFLRVAGSAGLSLGLLRPSHAYMLPAGVLLLALTTLAGVRLRRMWTALGRRLDAVAVHLALALRSRAGGVDHGAGGARRAASEPSFLGRALSIWLPLAVVQIGLFTLQENLESAFAGAPAPGVGAISGVHWAAPLIHAAVAFVLALAIAAFFTGVATRVQRIARTENLLRELWRRLRREARPLTPQSAPRPRLIDVAPRQLSRPPPGFCAA
jgi:hypothetical protein